jgi:hypothetical protein
MSVFASLAEIILPRRSVHVEPRFREPPPSAQGGIVEEIGFQRNNLLYIK